MDLIDFHALARSPSSALWSKCEAAMMELSCDLLAADTVDPGALAIAVALKDAAIRADAFVMMARLHKLTNESTDAQVRAAALASIPAWGRALARIQAATRTGA